MGHVTQALELGQGALATGSKVRVGALCQAASPPDEMGQTGLSLGHPGLVNAIAIADQDTLPVINEGEERLCDGAVLIR